MDPNQPRYSIDYLNQIAPQEKRTFAGDKMFFFVIGGGLLLAIIVGILMLTSNRGPDLTTRIETMAAQMQTLQSIAQNANSQSITSNQLQSINANLALQLTTANAAIAKPLAENNIPTPLPDKVIAANADTDLVTKLADAKLNAVFDRTYSTNMSYELTSLIIQMNDLEKDSSSKSLQDFIIKTRNNLAPIQKQLQEFADQSQ